VLERLHGHSGRNAEKSLVIGGGESGCCQPALNVGYGRADVAIS
jgi:hypothetical protein